MKTSILGLNENLAAVLAYVFGFIGGIPILIFERENKFVRFAALQSTIFTLIMLLILGIFGFLSNIFLIGFIFGMINLVLRIITIAVWLYLIFMAWRGQAVKLPILGDSCWEHVHK